MQLAETNVVAWNADFACIADAAVNTGCSGGPVLSSSGLVVGMTVAIASPSGAFAGIGFAIPIHVVRAVAEMLIDSGGKRTLPSPSLGVTLVPARFARRLGLKEGVLVLSVHASGGAASAGIRGTRVGRNGTLFLGDVIVAINDVEVDEAVDLWREVWHKGNVGDEVKLKMRRQGEGEMIVKVRLGDSLESAEDGEDAEAVGSGERELNRQLPRAKL